MLAGAAGLLLAGISRHAGAQKQDSYDFPKGDIPLTPEEFARLPHTPTYRGYLPVHVDLSPRLPPIGTQKRGDCTAWAVGYVARSYYVSAIEHRDLSKNANIPSVSFIYDSLARGRCDAGTRIPDALQLLTDGAPSERDVPYNPSRCTPPTLAQLSLPRDFYVAKSVAVDPRNPDQIKRELKDGNPVVISIHSTEAFEQKMQGDQVYAGAPGIPFTGRHAIAVVGYDEHRQAFRVANSWGTAWGDRGFGWIAYGLFSDPDQISAAYVMRLKPTPPAPHPDVPPVVVVPPSPHPKPGPTPQPKPAPVEFAGIECGKLNVIGRKDGHVVTGFVGSEQDLSKVRAQAAPAHLTVEVDVRPWPQCEALLTLDEQLVKPDAPKARILREGRALQAGDFLRFEIETPNYPSFLHVSYIQADGSVVNLIQPDNLNMRAYPPRTKLLLGAEGGGPRFQVAAPFGHEMLIVMASRSPLFGHQRPTTETEREFLTGVRAELVSIPAPNAPARVIAAAYDTLVTTDAIIDPMEPKPQ